MMTLPTLSTIRCVFTLHVVLVMISYGVRESGETVPQFHAFPHAVHRVSQEWEDLLLKLENKLNLPRSCSSVLVF